MDIAKTRVAVIGAGFFAEKHLEVVSAFGDVELVGISGRGNARIYPLADRFEIKDRFSNYEQMIDSTKPDAVLVLVNAGNIFEVAANCLERRVPTLLEKPPGLRVAETKRLRDIAQASDCLNMVGLNRRFYSVAQKAREMIAASGPLISVVVEAPERLAEIKGVHPTEIVERLIFANGIHSIDLLRFFGGDVSEMHSMTGKWNEEQDNSFAALMKFENGAVGQYIAHWMAPGSWNVTLYGMAVRIELNPLERGIKVDASGTTAIEPDEMDKQYKPGLYAQDRYFIDCIRDGRKPAFPAANLDDAVKTMELVKSISGASE